MAAAQSNRQSAGPGMKVLALSAKTRGDGLQEYLDFLGAQVAQARGAAAV